MNNKLSQMPNHYKRVLCSGFLAPYFPYSVKIEHPTLMNGKRKISELYSIKEFHIEIHPMLYVEISQCKLILKPISDLSLLVIEEFEKHMLRSFFRYIKKFPEHDWLHWNMNSDTYGFYALEHRAQTLNITPTVIKGNHKYNLVGILQNQNNNHKFSQFYLNKIHLLPKLLF